MLSLFYSFVDGVVIEDLHDWIDGGFTIVYSTVILYGLLPDFLLWEALHIFNSENDVVHKRSVANAFPDSANRASDSVCSVTAATSSVPHNSSRATFGLPAALAAILSNYMWIRFSRPTIIATQSALGGRRGGRRRALWRATTSQLANPWMTFRMSVHLW